MTEIRADTEEVRHGAAQLLRSAGGLHGLAGLADAAGSAGGGPPMTAAALGTLGRDWRAGLDELGDALARLGAYADAVAAAFDRVGG